MELSYSQNLEDYHLSLAFAGQTTGTYIDVGAGHPIADNVSFWFYERGWQGIVVEPQPELVALYQRLRPRDLAIRGLVGRHCGEMDFHVVERLHGLSTTVEGLAQKAKAFGVDYQTVRTPVTTLAKLCESHDLGAIDFLKIDVEGAEGDVLFGGDWKRFRPKVIVAEAVTPWRQSRHGRTGNRSLLLRATASSVRHLNRSMSRKNIVRSWRAFRPSGRRGTRFVTCTR
jgi:methyltransferase, FkbM family